MFLRLSWPAEAQILGRGSRLSQLSGPATGGSSTQCPTALQFSGWPLGKRWERPTPSPPRLHGYPHSPPPTSQGGGPPVRTLCSHRSQSHCLLTDLLKGSAWGCWNACCRTSPALVFFASCSFDLVSGFLAEAREGSEVSPWAIFQVTQGHCLGDFPPTHQVTVPPLYSLEK